MRYKLAPKAFVAEVVARLQAKQPTWTICTRCAWRDRQGVGPDPSYVCPDCRLILDTPRIALEASKTGPRTPLAGDSRGSADGEARSPSGGIDITKARPGRPQKHPDRKTAVREAVHAYRTRQRQRRAA